MVLQYFVPDLIYTWWQQLLENTLKVGWEDDKSIRPAQARHMSSEGLKCPCPNDLLEALYKEILYKVTWEKLHDNKYNGLASQNMYTIISKEKYRESVLEKWAKAMVLTLKKDEDGNPVYPKSSIVVLENLKKQI